MSLRVCMISTSYPRFPEDTSAPFIASIAEGIVASGHQVDMVLPWHPELQAGNRNGVQIYPYRVPGDSIRPVWGYAQSMQADVKLKKWVYLVTPFAIRSSKRLLRQLTSQTRYDILHAHWSLPNGWPAAVVAHHKSSPLVVSLQ